jgi:hypothetical protein
MTNPVVPATRIVLAASLLLAAVAVPAHADKADPAAPTFDGWVVKSDTIVPRDRVAPIEAKLGGKIKSLRNTEYEVNSKKVQINVLVAADAAAGDAIRAALTTGKAQWAVVRKGEVLYEFVGKNDATEEMKKAAAALAAP